MTSLRKKPCCQRRSKQNNPHQRLEATARPDEYLPAQKQGKQGQAALEFLTTYGWAFLIILIMMAAISYFGFINPGKFLPNKCVVGSEFSCQDYQVTDQGNVRFKLTQNVGKSIIAGTANCTIEGTTSTAGDMTHDGSTWNNREIKEFVCSFPAGTFLEGERVKILVELAYRLEAGGYPHETDGEIYAKVVKE